MTLSRRRLLQFAASTPLMLPSSFARAQAYPTRPVRVIATAGPGGQGDITARLVAAKLTEATGQSFYVENIAGAGGNSITKPICAGDSSALRPANKASATTTLFAPATGHSPEFASRYPCANTDNTGCTPRANAARHKWSPSSHTRPCFR